MIYKILLQRNFPSFLLLFFLQISCTATYSQKSYSYGVQPVNDVSVYRQQVLADSAQRMVELQGAVPGLQYDLRYATRNNFMHRRMYPAGTQHSFLRAPAAQALAAVQAELSTRGYGLKLFDGYRPYGVTVRFWELVKDERYVANPTKGSGHNRGLAADLTIIELSSGKELDMGTGFDNFTDSAHQGFTGLPPAVQENRQLLRKVMVKHGFTPLETEWWHYYWPNDKDYAVLDLDFAALLRYP